MNKNNEKTIEGVNTEHMNGEKKFDVKALIEKGKAQGSLSNSEIMEALEDVDYDIEQIEKLYDSIFHTTSLLL